MQSLSYWRAKIRAGFTDDRSIERYAMWYYYVEDEREKRGVPAKKRQGERGKDKRPRKRPDRTIRIRQAAPLPPAWVPDELRWD